MLRGSVLFPDRLLHKLHGRGLAKSTICWISLFPALSSFLPSLLPCSCLSDFFSTLLQMQIKKKKKKTKKSNNNTRSHSQTVYTTRAFCWLEQRALLRTTRQFAFFFFPPARLFFFFFQSICYQTSLGMQQSLVRGPAFLAISRMI